MRIWVKTFTDKTIGLEVNPTDEIKKVKEMIFDKEGINVDQQRLIWVGKQLTNDKTLKYYGLEDGNTLHLVTRLEGG